MNDVDALIQVYRMAYHANDLKGRPWTDEEREALDTAKRYIENNFPVGIRTMLWDIGLGKPGLNYVPVGGAGNGA